MRSLLQRLGKRLRHDERGFTLTELLVTVMIGMATLMMVVELVDASQNASSRVVHRVDGTQRGRVAMEQITQRIRSQVCLGSVAPVIAGDDDSVTLYVDLEDETYRPQVRRMFVTGGELREEITDGTGTPPDLTFPTTPTLSRTVLEDVMPYTATPQEPFFSFYAYAAGSPPRPTVRLATPLSAADLRRVVRVEVAFKAGGLGADPNVDTNFKNGVTTRLADPTNVDPMKRGVRCA